jgi:hypothetical protein
VGGRAARGPTGIGKVQVELNDVKASGDLRNQCLYPLQELKRTVEAQTGIAHIDQAKQGATDALDEAFEKIEAAARQKQKPGGISDKDDKVYVKPRRVVKVATLAPTGYLETKADIDAYLTKLRSALESAIEAGERVEIR